ncbi:unannotated protein [freshwater metagenome]|uniref:Unannotated protein n=1 Tax=freshwater metagenome TaxID=449393 RepID=A0A6J6UCW7_9ZZZZ
MMSVPRPAMLVATVTAPFRPASATMAASRSCCFAFKTSWRIPTRVKYLETTSLFSTLVVPTKTGWPALCFASMSATTALNLESSVL